MLKTKDAKDIITKPDEKTKNDREQKCKIKT
jgi:hypothetical protein